MRFQYDSSRFKKLASTGRQDALGEVFSVSELFHENTKLTPLSYRWYCGEIARLLKASGGAAPKLPHKPYGADQQVPLPAVKPATDLETSIVRRRSGRKYLGGPISLDELSKLFFFSYGLTDRHRGLRAVASAGALYPLEIYAVPLQVSGLPAGIYHYNVEDHSLDRVERGEHLQALKRCVNFVDVQLADAALVVLVTGIFERSTFKYKDRGYRLLLMEAGGLAQTFCLVAGGMGLGACLLGGFLDDELSRLLDIDGSEEAPLLPMVVGRIAGPPEAKFLSSSSLEADRR